MKKKQRIESDIHRKAFERYYELKKNNEKDIPEKMAAEYGIKERTINQWSSDFKWKEKIQDIERKATEEANAELVKNITGKKKNTLDFLIKYMEKVEREMLTEKREGYFIKEYVELLKAFQLITGDATERTENTNTNINELTEEDRELVKDLAKSIKDRLEIKAEVEEE